VLSGNALPLWPWTQSICVLHTLVDRVELDPKTRKLTLHYRLNVKPTGVKLASPRGFDHNSGAVPVASYGTLPRRAPRRAPQKRPGGGDVTPAGHS